ncbi:MAG: hypothetical protein ACXVNN_09045 [Bacteroidia bacterium]
MERRFMMNDFEQLLKEHADEFKMIPSKRVWHGIYNDLHPGRRWPSITMSLLLIFTLVVIGHLNTHTGTQIGNSKKVPVTSKNVASNLKPTEISKVAQKIAPQKNISSRSNAVASTEYRPGNVKSNAKTNINNYTPNNNLVNDALLAQNIKLTPQSGSAQFEKNNIFLPELNANPTNIENNIFDYSNIQSINNVGKKYEIINERIAVNNSDNLNSSQQITIRNSNLKYTETVTDNKTDKEITKNKHDEGDKKLTKPKRKKNAKISWVYFAAPQVNSVLFHGEPIRPLMNAGNSPAVAINLKEYKVLHNSALGFEGGVQINYSITKKLSFTSGLHVTYSGYNITSNEVHPTFANLFLKDPATGNVYSKSYITHYGDGTGQTGVSIRNYNLQASIPIGLQYELPGNNKVQLNAAADFEPSMVIKSNAYILSSDGRNYVNDPDLLRKINMSSNFGVFVTFLSSRFKWQVGPNVRYQWLSTYKKDYPIQEHLIDYGIRIGISPIRK